MTQQPSPRRNVGALLNNLSFWLVKVTLMRQNLDLYQISLKFKIYIFKKLLARVVIVLSGITVEPTTFP